MASELYRKIANLLAEKLPVGHAKVDGSVVYLGVGLEDALRIAGCMEILRKTAIRD